MVGIADVLTNSSNISLLIEVMALSLIVLSFFRWYNRVYTAMVTNSKKEVLEKLDSIKDGICDDIKEIKSDVTRLENKLFRLNGVHNREKEY